MVKDGGLHLLSSLQSKVSVPQCRLLASSGPALVAEQCLLSGANNAPAEAASAGGCDVALADKPTAPAFVRFWGNSGQIRASAYRRNRCIARGPGIICLRPTRARGLLT